MLFIFGCAGSSLLCQLFVSCGEWRLAFSCGAWTSHFSGFSCCRAPALSAPVTVVAAPGLLSTGSTVVALWA